MEFIIKNREQYEILKRIHQQINTDTFQLNDLFYHGINFETSLSDLDADMFGCWNGACIDSFKMSQGNSIQQQFLSNLLHQYNQQNDKSENKIRFTFGDNIYYTKEIKKELKTFDKDILSQIISSANGADLPLVNGVNLSDESLRLINTGFDCFGDEKMSFMTLGNHDVEMKYIFLQQIRKCFHGEDSMRFNDANQNIRINTRWVLPNAFYSVRINLPNKSLLFVIVDTNLLDYDYKESILDTDMQTLYIEKMMKWLENTLKENNDCLKIVIGHIPLFYFAHKDIQFTSRYIEKVEKDKKDKKKKDEATGAEATGAEATGAEATGAEATAKKEKKDKKEKKELKYPKNNSSFIQFYDCLIHNNVRIYLAADEHNLQCIQDTLHNISHITCGASPGGGGSDETNTFELNEEKILFRGDIAIPEDVHKHFVKKIIVNAPSFLKLHDNTNMIQINLVAPEILSPHSKHLLCSERSLCVNTVPDKAKPSIYYILSYPKFSEYISIYDCDKFRADRCK
jgi:hypothetical protein